MMAGMRKKEREGRNIIVYGVSRGLGAAIFKKFPKSEDTIFGVSRSTPSFINDAKSSHWIEADLGAPIESTQKIAEDLGDMPLDILVYNVGIWEEKAFSDAYDFESVPADEVIKMVTTNITSAILHIQALLPNLRLSANAKVILVGSTWGLPNHKGKELVFSATKFALKGMLESLREIVREDKIGVSVLSLGYLATEFEIDVPIKRVLEESHYSMIPLQDVLSAIEFIASTSSATCVKEIIMPAMIDENV
ncbi:SDR family oxidoreductase [Ignatzschineria rhizosphaerae]|uniref:SDR family oxidoreductase n=1 Tax=Ignatzschineria rhizosphaerae TaxID=2923279 RepID=A0ABY3X0Z4_9GAMM|nr:SDR family oxidoreductase [Ignatzschineria rhizosphaerae]UNM96549.1 SDR family oxidoreductase [Ignatzschineria rhizosphaerae]